MAWMTIAFELLGGVVVLVGAWIPIVSLEQVSECSPRIKKRACLSGLAAEGGMSSRPARLA
jgi:hypothetical protein